MLLLKLIIDDSLHETTLAYSCVSNDDEFEKMILNGYSSVLLRQNLKWHGLDLLYLTLFHTSAYQTKIRIQDLQQESQSHHFLFVCKVNWTAKV